ncbi:hypothetical protein JY414_09495 [Stenotrophomonas maltophilia]|nr:hypothetical protein [Stenotrophomonas maltophilia]MBN5057339.1 hypothetical protein [Stenotrophomonas maltophilia]MBN5065768.1 hypothetical protein [Stenotrophomonas maltophilia]
MAKPVQMDIFDDDPAREAAAWRVQAEESLKHFQFQHARDCAVASTSDPHPWVTFVRLVTPIIEAVEKAEKAAPHG